MNDVELIYWYYITVHKTSFTRINNTDKKYLC